jgi:hypothetical protein
MLGASSRTRASSGGRNTAETPSGAPMIKRRADIAGSNGSAVATTFLTRARISRIGPASSVARAVGTTPLGVRRNRGSFSKRRSLPSPWLTADGERFSLSGRATTKDEQLFLDQGGFAG